MQGGCGRDARFRERDARVPARQPTNFTDARGSAPVSCKNLTRVAVRLLSSLPTVRAMSTGMKNIAVLLSIALLVGCDRKSNSGGSESSGSAAPGAVSPGDSGTPGHNTGSAPGPNDKGMGTYGGQVKPTGTSVTPPGTGGSGGGTNSNQNQ